MSSVEATTIAASMAGAPVRPPAWWQGAVGYQVYLRSFADGDGDGVGDLGGLLGRLDHLVDLGVDVVWISPFYPSPQADHGYDVSDHRDVDPTFGSLADLEAVVTGLHERGIRLLVDLIPNHTSSQHPWFEDACSGRESRHRQRYHWQDPAPDGGPPNNWVSKFGGSAWAWHAPTGQYYLHTFLPEQPDLNWSDPLVGETFEATLRFWLDRGVDGFRVDAAHCLLKHPDLPDNPRLRDVAPDADSETVYDAFDHVHDVDQAAVVDIYRRWRHIANDADAILLGEVVLSDPRRVQRYVEEGGLDVAFCFPALKVGWDAAAIRAILGAALDAGSGSAWPLSSHDDPRAAERFGGGADGARRSLSFLALLCALPGMVFLLQGDELGLDHGQADADASRDPLALRHPGAAGRDGSRTPMPWDDEPGFGFTSGTPWIPFPSDRSVEHTVAWQSAHHDSPLATTRRVLRARRALAAEPPQVTWLDAPAGVVAIRRGSTVVALNTGAAPRRIVVPDGTTLRFSTHPHNTRVDGGVLVLPGDATAYVR
jgi:alpha-glucosidase